MVSTETRFVLSGFLLVISASALGGLRWALTEMLLHTNKATSNPFSTLCHLAPVMCVSLLVVALCVEGPVGFFQAELWSDKGIFLSLLILLAPSILAFFMNVTEFT